MFYINEKKFCTHQFPISWRGAPSYDTVIGSHHDWGGGAAHSTHVPAKQVLEWLGVHVGLPRALGLAPQEHPEGAASDGERGATVHLLHAAIVSVKVLDEARNVLILGLSMAKSAITSKAPWIGPLLGINSNLHKIQSLLVKHEFIYLLSYFSPYKILHHGGCNLILERPFH